VEAQDGEDPRRAETRPTTAEKKPTKGSNETHDGEGKQRERLGRNHLKILHLKTPPPKSPHNNAKSPKAPKLNRISKHNNLNHTQTQTNVINPQQIKSMDSSHRPLWVSSPPPFVGLCSPSSSPPLVGFFSAALCGSLLAFAVAALCGFLLRRCGSLLCPSWSSPS
jgi:hypothetical protein